MNQETALLCLDEGWAAGNQAGLASP